MIVGVALLLVSLALRGASANRLVRSRLLTSCVLFRMQAALVIRCRTGRYRTVRKNARTSSTSSSGCSNAAK